MAFVAELKRRNVFRAAAAYVAVAWLVMQVAEVTFPAFGLSDRALRLLILALAIGFVPATALAWVFELTPEGFKRERDLDRSGPLAARTNRLLDRAIVVLLALGLTYFAVDKFFLSPAREQVRVEEAIEQGRTQALEAQLGDKSIVVLPFTNLSADPDQEFFADGMAEELLNLLARIPELRVISRTSAFAFKGKDVGVDEIAGKLKVSHVLEGSVRRSGDRLRIAAQLIDAKTDSQLWSETYDRTLDDVFAVQDEIAARVIEALKLELLGALPPIRRADPQAQALYIQARQMLDSFAEDYARIDGLLRRAIEIDPGYADPWTGIAWVYWRCVIEPEVSSPPCAGLTAEEALHEHDAAIEEALRVDPDNGPALAYKAMHHAWRKGDFPGTAPLLERAVALDPTKTDVLRSAIIYANQVRQPDIAVRIGRYLLSHDPLCSICQRFLMAAFIQDGQLADAEAMARDRVAAGGGGEESLGSIVLLRGRPAEALEIFSRLPEESVYWRLGGEAMALHSLGRRDESRAALARLLAEYSGGAVQASRLAEVHAWIGEPAAAAEWVRRSLATKDLSDTHNRFRVMYSPFLGEVLERPEVQDDLRAYGLAQEQLEEIHFEIRLPDE
jgi:adenylate cyclase